MSSSSNKPLKNASPTEALSEHCCINYTDITCGPSPGTEDQKLWRHENHLTILRFWFRLFYRFLSLLSFGHHWNNCLFWLQRETSKRHAQKACQPHNADHQRNNWWSTSLSHSPLQTSAYKSAYQANGIAFLGTNAGGDSVATCDPLSHQGLHHSP